MAGGLSHTAKYATGIEVIQPHQHGVYLKARSAIYHADRSSDGAQIFWSAPLRKWLKLYGGEYNGARGIVCESHSTCPCGMR